MKSSWASMAVLVVGLLASILIVGAYLGVTRGEGSGEQVQVEIEAPAPVGVTVINDGCLKELNLPRLRYGMSLYVRPESDGKVATIDVLGTDSSFQLNAASGPHLQFVIEPMALVKATQPTREILIGGSHVGLVGRFLYADCENQTPELLVLLPLYEYCQRRDFLVDHTGRLIKEVFTQEYGMEVCENIPR